MPRVGILRCFVPFLVLSAVISESCNPGGHHHEAMAGAGLKPKTTNPGGSIIMEKTIREATKASGSPNHLPCQALETKIALQLETSQTQHKRADQGRSNNRVQHIRKIVPKDQ